MLVGLLGLQFRVLLVTCMLVTYTKIVYPSSSKCAPKKWLVAQQVSYCEYESTQICLILLFSFIAEQDFTLGELLLDVLVVRSPDGLFYCGDPCQAIMRGVSFRFSDCKTMLFQELQNIYTKKSNDAKLDSYGQLTLCQGPTRASSRKGKETTSEVRAPEILCLLVNMRTHAGIVNVGASIVDIIYSLFPR